jgi:hypothetical protein
MLTCSIQHEVRETHTVWYRKETVKEIVADSRRSYSERCCQIVDKDTRTHLYFQHSLSDASFLVPVIPSVELEQYPVCYGDQ